MIVIDPLGPGTMKTPLGPAVIVDPSITSTGVDVGVEWMLLPPPLLPPPVSPPPPPLWLPVPPLPAVEVGGGDTAEVLPWLSGSAVPELLTMTDCPSEVKRRTLVCVTASIDDLAGACVAVASTILLGVRKEHCDGSLGATSAVILGRDSMYSAADEAA